MQRLISYLVASRKRTITFAVTLLLLLALTATLFAAWFTINTNDGLIDANWASVPEWDDTLACDDPGIDDKYEMAKAFVTQDGDSLYFRMDTCAVVNPKSDFRAIAAIDCNNDGDVEDPLDPPDDYMSGDRILVYRPDQFDGMILYDGKWATDPNNATVIAQFDSHTLEEWMDVPLGTPTYTVFEWQLGLDNLYPACRGSTSEVGVTLATVEASVFAKELRDSSALQPWFNPMDFGDASNILISQPTPPPLCSQYNTVMFCDGPRHGLGDGLKLGNEVDADGGGLQDEPARADDTDNVADEDGVEPSYGVVWSAGSSGSLDVTVSGGSGVLNCWTDWNNDEDFADTGEYIINESAVTAGDHTLALAVPAGVDFTTSPFYTRCRLAPGAGVGNVTTGAVWDGEVEDHLWLPQAATIDIALSGSGSDAILSWSHLTQNESYQAYRSTSPYFRLGDASALAPIVSANPWQYTDSSVAGNASPNAYYYVVVGRKDVGGTIIESTPSREVGLFEFGLTPGSA